MKSASQTNSGKGSRRSAVQTGCADTLTACPKDMNVYSAAQIEQMVRTNQWWPFDRVDGKILVKLHKQNGKNFDDAEDALI